MTIDTSGSTLTFILAGSHAREPEQAYASAGYVLFSAERVCIDPSFIKRVTTGVIIQVPTGWCGRVIELPHTRQLGRYSVTGDGHIDGTYLSSAKVCITNLRNKKMCINTGDPIAFLVVHPVFVPIGKVTCRRRLEFNESDCEVTEMMTHIGM